jgi:hypothetical protein
MNWVFVRGFDPWSLALSDTTADVNGPFDAIYTGSGGSIKFTGRNGQTIALTNVAAGVTLPLACTRVWSTGTTATGMAGLKTPGAGG